MKNSYATAYMVIMVLEVLGWLTVGASVLVLLKIAFSGARHTAPSEFLLPAVIFGAGIVQVASAQITRAVVATAIDSARAVDVLERIERKLGGAQAAGGGRAEPAVVGTRPVTGGQPVGSAIKRYKGRLILRAGNGVKIEGEDQVFANVIAAERFIDGR